MPGQMCWLPINHPDGEIVLHLRTNPNESWQPYRACPQYAAPDDKIPEGSKGWATYQKLMRSGWTLVPGTQTNKKFVLFQQARLKR